MTPAAANDQSHASVSQNGPFSTCDPHPTNTKYSSDNDEDSETDNEALQKEMKRLKEKYATCSTSCLIGRSSCDFSDTPFSNVFACTSLVVIPACRHLLEIQALQTRQKEEIESLFTRMGKPPPPPSALSPAVAMTGGRRRRKSHRSSRSSGQPSPIHSGRSCERDSEPRSHFPSCC